MPTIKHHYLLPTILGAVLVTGGCSTLDMSVALAPGIDSTSPPPKLQQPEELPKPRGDQSDNGNATEAMRVPLLPPQPTPTDEQKFNEDRGESRPIDLPTALHLADARNPLVAYTREQVRQSYALLEKADVLWLPSIRAGAGYNHHDGAIQDVDGRQIDASRNGFYSGLGASTFAGGAPIVPGVWANFQLADAIFQPLAAQQQVGVRRAAAGVELNDTLLQVATAYLELLRAKEALAIANETQQHAQALNDLCQAYATTGEGLQSDADRAATELALRQNNTVQSAASIIVASARLAQLLHLNPALQLEPIEPLVTPLTLIPKRDRINDLMAQAMSTRPELIEARHLVNQNVALWKREEYAPLVPNILLGVSDGGMTAGHNADYAAGQNRFDMDAIAYWELRNFGFGDQAARRGARSSIDQARWQQVGIADLVAREVTEADVQVRALREQIQIAERGVQVAVASYQRNLDRIKDVKGLPIEVLQSLQALDQARVQYLRVVIDYNAAQFTLLRALGWPNGPAIVNHIADAGQNNE